MLVIILIYVPQITVLVHYTKNTVCDLCSLCNCKFEKHPPHPNVYKHRKKCKQISFKGKRYGHLYRMIERKKNKDNYCLNHGKRNPLVIWIIPMSLTWKTRRFFRREAISAYLQIFTHFGKRSNSLTEECFPNHEHDP